MLLLDSALDAAGLTVFADHADAGLFHCLPGSPHVVSGAGRPGVQLLRYRGDRQGAFLALDVDLMVEDRVLAAARDELSRRLARDVRLVPVLFRAGTVRLTTLSAESRPQASGDAPTAATAGSSWLVENILASTRPSLLGYARAVFGVELSREGAKLLDDALHGADLPVIVAYELEFDGLQPARGLRAHVSYHMAYEYLRTRLRPNVLIFKADIDREAEALKREGHITIEDVDYSGSDPALQAQRLTETRQTLNELTEAVFFRPATSPAVMASTLPANSPVGAAWAQAGQVQAAFTFRGLNQEESGTLDYDYREARVARRRVAPQGALRIPPGVDPALVVRDVTLSEDPSFAEVRVFSLPDADWTGIRGIEVELRAAGGAMASPLLTALASEQRAILGAGGPIEYRTRVLADDDPDALGSAPRDASAFERLDGRVLQVDPARLAGRRLVTLALGSLDSAAGMGVTGRLTSGSHHREFVLTENRPETTVPVWKGMDIRVEWSIATRGTSGPVESRDLSPGESMVVFNQPADRYQTLVIMLQDPLERIQSVSVDLEQAAGGERRSVRLDAASPRAEWPTLRTGPSQTYRYRGVTVARDGTVQERPFREHAGPLLVVGDTDIRVESIQVVLAGWPASLGALVRLTSLHPPPGVNAVAEKMLDPATAQFEARLPFKDGEPTRYRVEGSVFLESEERPIGPVESSAEILILDLSAH
jgi:hypothetical protein